MLLLRRSLNIHRTVTIIILLCFTIVLASFPFQWTLFIGADDMCTKQVEVISKSLIGRKSHAVKHKEGSGDLNYSCS